MKKTFYCVSISHDNKLKIETYVVTETDPEMDDFDTFEQYVSYIKTEAVAAVNQQFATAIIMDEEHIKEFIDELLPTLASNDVCK